MKKQVNYIMLGTGIVLLLGWSGASLAATPPERINVQGVLRDSAGNPVNGAVDMFFNLFDRPDGCAISEEGFLLSDFQSVNVSGGLFNVALGAGELNPAGASGLREAFRDNTEVWVEFTVAGPPTERLCPRVRVESVAYSLNADHLDGKDATEFIDTSATPQTKAGDLTVGGNLTLTAGGLEFPDGSVQTSGVNSLPPDTCFDNVGRFVVCGDGAVKDNLTGLFWLENANCFGTLNWASANIAAAQLADGQCGLTDGSSPGDWRLPTDAEWQVIIDQAAANGCVSPGPFVPNTFGTGCWSEGDPFAGVQSVFYWSSSTFASFPNNAWLTSLVDGVVFSSNKTFNLLVWPVRAGP